MKKPRVLYYATNSRLKNHATILAVVVSKVVGVGFLRSYGGHHATPLDRLLSGALPHLSFDHPDGYLDITNLGGAGNKFLTEHEINTSLYIISKYYSVSERVEMEWGEFFTTCLNAK